MSRADLRACGFSPAAVRRRIEAGHWQRWGGAVILSPAPPTPVRRRPGARGLEDSGLEDTGLAWALQITYGPRAVVSGPLALRRVGWQVPSDALVVVVPEKPRTGMDGVEVVRRDLGRVILRPDGLRFAPAGEALVDTLVSASTGQAAGLLDHVLQRRWITPEEFARVVEARLGWGRRGAKALRSLRDRALSGSRSEAEHRMGALLARSRTGPWVANHPVRDPSGRVVAEIDFAHEGLRIAIEVDGRAHHTDRRAFERDRVRQNMLVVRGWLVLRFTWEQITQRPREVLAAIDAAVRMRMAG